MFISIHLWPSCGDGGFSLWLLSQPAWEHIPRFLTQLLASVVCNPRPALTAPPESEDTAKAQGCPQLSNAAQDIEFSVVLRDKCKRFFFCSTRRTANNWLSPSPKGVLYLKRPAHGGGPALPPGCLQVLPGCPRRANYEDCVGDMMCSVLILQPLLIRNLSAKSITSLICMMLNCLLKRCYPLLSIHIFTCISWIGGWRRKEMFRWYFYEWKHTSTTQYINT